MLPALNPKRNGVRFQFVDLKITLSMLHPCWFIMKITCFAMVIDIFQGFYTVQTLHKALCVMVPR